jgi:predicted nucleic acid-binding protein
MALYSLDKPSSIARVSGQVIVPDTSYLIPLRMTDHPLHDIIRKFHSDVLAAGSEFIINVVNRHEQLRDARKRDVVKALKSLVAANNPIEARYRSLPEFSGDTRSTAEIIEQGSEYRVQ